MLKGDQEYSSKHKHGVVAEGRAASGAHLPKKAAAPAPVQSEALTGELTPEE